MAKTKLHAEMLVGISAGIIGICALGVSLYEASLMRKEQRAAVIPIMQLGSSYNISESDPSKNRLALVAQNVGIGPARVLDVTVTVDEHVQPTWDAVMRELAGQDRYISHKKLVINGRTLPPGMSVEIFELTDMDVLHPILADFGRLEFEVCYCSVFDECWTARYSAFGASEPVEFCARSDGAFTE